MDYEKLVEELVDGPLGDLIRERLVASMLEDLAGYTERFTYESDEIRERDRAWATDVAEYLRDNWL